MAACGIASRRNCDEMIAAGRVCLNGVTITRLGTTILPGIDKITLDDVAVVPPLAGHVYFMLHKPRGYLTTARDERGRPTIYSLLKGIRERVVPVGRLDLNSEGLLLLTNDGELAHKLMHPRFRIEKEYEVWVDGLIKDEALRQLREGVKFSGGRTRPALVTLEMETVPSGRNQSHFFMTIREGRKRQVRLMCQAVGHHVCRLRRIREGCLNLGNLPYGKYRRLTTGEINALKAEISDNKR